jgi:deoxyadenosine/deoxycytidine kinase
MSTLLSKHLQEPGLDELRNRSHIIIRERGVSRLVILEFARSLYQESFTDLGGRGVEVDLVIYLDVSLQTALERNRIRARRTEGDNHFVSEKEMKLIYATDDINDLIRGHSTKTTIIRNEVLDESHGQESADKIIQLLKAML